MLQIDREKKGSSGCEIFITLGYDNQCQAGVPTVVTRRLSLTPAILVLFPRVGCIFLNKLSVERSLTWDRSR